MINKLKDNIEAEIGIVRELSHFLDEMQHSSGNQRKMFLGVIESLSKMLKMINGSLPRIIKEITAVKGLPPKTIKKKIKIKKSSTIESESKHFMIKSPVGGKPGEKIALSSEFKKSFLKELDISENLVRKLKKSRLGIKKKPPEFKKPNAYAKISNKLFFETAKKWVKQGNFKNLSLDLKKSNLNILTTTYISMMIFSIILAFVAGIFLFIFLLFFDISLFGSSISLYHGSYLLRMGKVFWVIGAVPLAIGVSFYLYPAAEKKSLSTRIDRELPFMVVHMGSIAGSGIEPAALFKIIGMSKEYEYAGGEVKKILNQTNVYGYDLSTALKNVARSTPSTKLSELLNGMSITINSGGDMKTFFEKRAESLLLGYRLEREKFTKVAETFMDIYISVVIATPMVLLLLLIMISVSGIQIGGFSVTSLTILIIGIVGIINILFLIFLHLQQPSY